MFCNGRRQHPCYEQVLRLPTQRPEWLDGFSANVLWDSVALVSVLSALLQAHVRLAKPMPYQTVLLMQATAQLATLPCGATQCLSV